MTLKDLDNTKQITKEELLNCGKPLPQHIGIIMDGNGRWAKSRNLPRVAGHKSGVDSVREIVRATGELHIPHLTLYAFSTENWNRPNTEVSVLMNLLLHYLKSEINELNEKNVKLNAIGQLNALPKSVQKQLFNSIDFLSKNDGLTLTLALSYSGRWDIIRAVQTLALDVRRGKLSPEDITNETFKSYLTTHNLPDPDVIIRTSGEMRISNFLLWEAAYSEIVVVPELWPDFRTQNLHHAISQYLSRERRFGKTGDQIKESGISSLVKKVFGGK